jgi:hypothetical protein
MSPSNSDHQRKLALEVIALLLILGLAAYVRLANHTDNPGWYTDEGTHLDIAQNLMHGRVQYMAINQATLLFSRLPLFELLLARSLSLMGGGIGTLRALTGGLGVVSVAVLYGVVRRTQHGDSSLALLSALMYAIYPSAVLYSRFGFSYNLLTPLVLLAYLGLWEYLNTPPTSNTQRRGWLALAVLAIGIGAVSDLWMFVLTAPLLVVVLIRHWRDALWSFPLVLLPFGLYAVFMLVQTPGTWWFDLRFVLSRLNRLSVMSQLTTLALNYTILISRDHWAALAIIGMFMLRPARLQRLSLLMFLLPIVILGRTVALYNLSFYYMIPLLPFIGLGMASAIKHGVPFISQAIHSTLLALLEKWEWLSSQLRLRRLHGQVLSLSTSLILFAVVATPFLTSAIWTANQARDKYSTEIDLFLINPGDARRVAEFVNSQIVPNDVVIASPGLAWLFQAHTADFQMSVAFNGQETPHLPANLPKSRFAFNPDYRQAHFVVVDNLWRNWAVWNIAGVPDMLSQMQNWSLVFKSGEIEVYCNPTQNCSRIT